jgi:putative transposase
LEEKRRCVEPKHSRLSIQQQCALLGLARSGYYYAPRPVSALNVRLMRLIDEQYLRAPFYGAPRMTAWLRRQGYAVNPKRVSRLLRVMGLAAVVPRRRLSVSDDKARRFPYLLRDLKIVRPGQVWAADITYIRLQRGFMYLVAILDWFSRYVVAWEISLTAEADFCVTALRRALRQDQPEIFNTDQGCQFTSIAWTGVLESAGVRVSQDGRGRVFDNIMVERLWRSVKYEEVYLRDYVTAQDARRNLARYFAFYNHERPHQALDYATPAEIYTGQRAIQAV